MRILALQPWDGGSHRAVRRSIERHGRHEWSWHGLEPRGHRWRLRLGALELLERLEGAGGLATVPDVVFTTGMLDAGQLRAGLPRGMRDVPLVLYMHENQAAYPISEHVGKRDRERDAHLVSTNLASLLAADLVLWNSRFNLESFLEGAERMLEHLPGGGGRHWCERIRERSEIAWPPVEPVPEAVLRNPAKRDYADGVTVAWPHRSQHDKGPDGLLEIMDRMADRCDLRLILLGARPGPEPDTLQALRARHGARIVHDGWVEDRAAYLAHLSRADWVLSTADHEFFGIAVVEALLCGCLPWLPDRLSYPELLPDSARGLDPEHPPEDPAAVIAAVRSHLAPAVAPVAVERIEGLIEAGL